MTIHTIRRTVLAISWVASIAGSAVAMAQQTYPDRADSGAMAADLIFVRPFSLVGTVLGAAIFVVTLPFTLPTQSAEEAGRALVSSPLEYTFNRPLGDFDHCGATRHACGGG
ncbi:MAG TPA: hypothetical protein VL379_19375 [Pseudomonadales bacterium]|nr:hypothetical protein [Pseudomonadales bacterium]